MINSYGEITGDEAQVIQLVHKILASVLSMHVWTCSITDIPTCQQNPPRSQQMPEIVLTVMHTFFAL
jgi:hypothetical protein